MCRQRESTTGSTAGLTQHTTGNWVPTNPLFFMVCLVTSKWYAGGAEGAAAGWHPATFHGAEAPLTETVSSGVPAQEWFLLVGVRLLGTFTQEC